MIEYKEHKALPYTGMMDDKYNPLYIGDKVQSDTWGITHGEIVYAKAAYYVKVLGVTDDNLEFGYGSLVLLNQLNDAVKVR